MYKTIEKYPEPQQGSNHFNFGSLNLCLGISWRIWETKEKSVFQRGWPIFSQAWKNTNLNGHISNLRSLRVEINKAIEACRNKQIIGAALETEVNYLPEDKSVKDSLTWLEKFGDEDVDSFSDWLIVSNFQVVTDLAENSLIIDNNELSIILITHNLF